MAAKRYRDRDAEQYVAARYGSACQRCWQLEEELRDVRQRLAASGQYVAFSPGPNPNPNVDDEQALRRMSVMEIAWRAACETGHMMTHQAYDVIPK